MLACYLYELERSGKGADIFFEGGAAEWLEKVKPKVRLHPAAKLCVEFALKFLPKLKDGLDTHEKGNSDENDDDLDLFND